MFKVYVCFRRLKLIGVSLTGAYLLHESLIIFDSTKLDKCLTISIVKIQRNFSLVFFLYAFIILYLGHVPALTFSVFTIHL